MCRFLLGSLVLWFLGFIVASPVIAAPTISPPTIVTPGQIPVYSKFEATFSINNLVATQLQWPYDPNPPAEVTAGVGITVNAIFTNPFGQSFTQPAFLYQPFTYQVINNRDWLYPQGPWVWMVRFSPNQTGTWSYRLTAQDAGGTAQSSSAFFTAVANTDNHGFIKVSPNDNRYFEFSDGTYFPGLGYNMNWDHVGWINPITGNSANFTVMGQNGIQLVRLWLSEWAVYGAHWNPWRCILPRCSAEWPEITADAAYQDHQVAITMYAGYNACMSSGHWLSPPIAVKPNSDYRIRVRVKTQDIIGPRLAGQPYGFVAKVTDDGNSWLQGSGNNCQDPGVGEVVTSYLDNSDWTEIFGTYHSGNLNFLSSFYLTLTNLTQGTAYVDQVIMEENLGNGQYGPNIIPKPGMNHHQYADQNLSARFDQVVELAEQNKVYLRPVILEKNDDIAPLIDPNHGFFGNWRQLTAIRWYQQMWWRYLQARWGYSTAIHSWELVNEADPYSGLSHTLTDEFGKYMHCRVFGVEPGAGDGAKCLFDHPNDHLSSTSNWSMWPKDQFWANPNYPNVDFADVHKYISKTPQTWLENNFYDTALSTWENSMTYGAKQPNGTGKPVIRGESGLIDGVNTNSLTSEIASNDPQGIWLHNFVWGGINPGGLIESYWYENYSDLGHIYSYSHNPPFDFRPQFGYYYNFIKDVPLNNGYYMDAAVTQPANLRVWGQKDTVNNRAHLWIANAAYTWNNKTPTARSGSFTLTGFTTSSPLKVDWWNTYTGQVSSTTQIAPENGNLTLSVSNLVTDTAVRIGDYTPLPTFTPGPTVPPPVFDFVDLYERLMVFGRSNTSLNLLGSSLIDIFDLNYLMRIL
jgi:hypothetical protein